MTELAAIEIYESGIVTSVSIPNSPLWKILFPPIGSHITVLWNEATKLRINNFIQKTFASPLPLKFSINIHNQTFNCTAYKNSTDKATICWETVIEPITQAVENVGKSRLELVNFAFKNANTAIHFVKEDGSFYDFNDALNTKLGYTREEFFRMNILDIIPNITKEFWINDWKELQKKGQRTFFSQQRKKDGSLIDIELKTTLINYDGIQLNCAFINDITERKKLEKRLSIFEYSFKTISAPIIFFRKDGSLYDCNDAYCKLFGFEEDEITTLTLADFGAGYTTQSLEHYWETVKLHGSYSFISKRTKKDGTVIDVEIMPNFIKLGDTELICSFVKDITEYKKHVSQIQLIGHVFESVDTAIYYLKQDGSYYQANEAMCSMLGYTIAEFKKLGIFDVNPALTKESWSEVWNLQKEANNRIVYSRLKRKDGSFIDVEIKSKIIYFEDVQLSCAFITDITERKKLEESLMLVDFAFRRASVPMHFIKEDGQIFDCNRAACYLLGYTEEDYKKLTVFDINNAIPKESFKTIWKHLTFESDKVMYFKVTKKNGELIDIEVRSNKIKYGNLELMCSSFVDITEKIRTEEKLKMVDYAFRNASISMQFLRKDGSIYDFNKKAYETLGYTKEEYRNIGLFDFTLRHNPEGWKVRWEELKNGDNETFVAKIRRKDNSVIDVEMRTDIIEYENEELAFACTIDITDKKKTEEKLRIVDYAFRNASIPMHLLRKDGSVYDFNSNSPKLLGYTNEEFSKLNVLNFSIRHTPESWESRWEEFKMANKLTSVTKMRRKDNSLVEVELITDLINYGNEELTFTSVIDLTEKKRTEKKLKIVEHSFRNASIPMIFFRKDGSIYDFNKMASSLLGYSEEDFKNISIFDISIRHNLGSWERRWDELLKNTHSTFITKVRKNDNTVLDVEIRSDLFLYENDVMNFTSIIDITEKKKAEIDLKRSNDRYENALIATSDVIWEADLIEDKTYFSKNFTLIFGHKVKENEDRLNNTCRIHIHPDDMEKVNAINESLGQGLIDKWDFEYRMKKADGQYAIVLDRGFSVKDDNGKVLRLVGALQDITKRKAEEGRLKLLESVVVHTNDAIVIANATPINAPGPIIIYVNEAYTKITGYSLEESIGTNPRKLQNKNTDRKELDRFRNSLEKWQPSEMTIRNSRKNGEEFWANVRVTPVANEKGEFTHWVSVQRDVTKEIEAQKEKEVLMNELINNNNELKQFGYITTHNLRAPLTNLISICNMIDDRKIADEFTLKLITAFKQSTFLLNDTLNDLIKILFIKERMNVATSELQFEEVLNKVKDLISNTIDSKNVVIEADFSLAPCVKFSSIYLESLFLNLITNAIKYAFPNRSPIIKIATHPLPDNTVALTLSDNGLGMNMERIKGRIFGLYQRFHNNADSKGLGLYLVHSQVTALGGTIEVDSKVNIGTTFTITFKNEGKSLTL